MLNEAVAGACLWESLGHWELCVVGGGPAGIAASIAASRRGLRTVLVESFGYPGGVGTQSCCPIIFGSGAYNEDGSPYEGRIIGGFCEEFIRRMDARGAASCLISGKEDVPERLPVGDRPLTGRILMELETMKLEYRRMLEEAGVDCLFYSKLTDAVRGEDGSIRSVLLSCAEGPRLLSADRFIDCTGNGLLYADAGASVRKYPTELTMHKSAFFLVGGVEPYDTDFNRALYARLYKEGKVPGEAWPFFGHTQMLEPNVCLIPFNRADGDGVSSKGLTEMDGVLREEAFATVDFLRKYMPGFKNCYMLRTSEYVGVRAGWGIVGQETVTREYIDANIPTAEPVAIVRRFYGEHTTKKKGFESDWVKPNSGVITVPYRTMFSDEIPNAAAAGRCISSDGYTVSTFRMMNTCMATGETAGIAAAIASERSLPLNAVPYALVRPELDKLGAALKID